MKKIAIIGSTGSIGTNALDIIRHNSDLKVVALSANNNYLLLEKQIIEFKPQFISIGTNCGLLYLKSKFPNLEIFYSDDGIKQIGKIKEYDILLTAVSGSIGLEATIEAIKNGKRIALANKETMVIAGDLINNLVLKYNSKIIPVDSEHSAIFQSMLAGSFKEVKKIILTASGGPFRTYTKKMLKNVRLEDALKHPNWSMGKKITVDSATLINKGLEIIEAHFLFKIPYNQIEVIVHPESIIHSLVEFTDFSTIAQLGVPDMKLPISYAFNYPNRIESPVLKQLNLTDYKTLNFHKPPNNGLIGIDLARHVGHIGKSMPTVFNAANEVAVDLFLKRHINFLEIYAIIENAIMNHIPFSLNSISDIKALDLETRKKILINFSGVSNG